MELGALVCTPTAPKCKTCPLASVCVANRDSLQAFIPPPKTLKDVTFVREVAVVVREVAGCPECLPYPTYVVVAQDGTGLVVLRVSVGEDGDPGAGLAEQYGALASDRLARVVPD